MRAVGETGLDRYRTGPEGWAAQEASFRAHIRIAKEHGIALVIHDRDAHDEILRVLDDEGAPEHTVFHCFSGDAVFAKACVERGFVLSFAGTLTFGNAAYLREAAALTPPDQLLVETDSPFLTPMPHRGPPQRLPPRPAHRPGPRRHDRHGSRGAVHHPHRDGGAGLRPLVKSPGDAGARAHR